MFGLHEPLHRRRESSTRQKREVSRHLRHLNAEFLVEVGSAHIGHREVTKNGVERGASQEDP